MIAPSGPLETRFKWNLHNALKQCLPSKVTKAIVEVMGTDSIKEKDYLEMHKAKM